MNTIYCTMENKLCSDVVSHTMNGEFKYYLWMCLSWNVSVRTAFTNANVSLEGYLIPTNADFHTRDCFFNFCQLTYKYIFWMQPAKHTNAHIHIQTIWAVAGCHSALHPVVSLHASKLFSVTQILIWKSQLTELTETTEKGSKDPPSSFYCPFLLASAPFDR